MQYSKGNAVQGSDTQDELDILSILHQLFAKKWFIFIFTIACCFFSFVYAQIDRNEYTSTSVVQIEKRSSNISLPSEIVGELLAGEKQTSDLETEFHVIKSRLTLGEVVRALDLNVNVTPAGPPKIQDFFYRYSYLLRAYEPLKFIERQVPQNYAFTGDALNLVEFESFRPEQSSYFKITAAEAGLFRIDFQNPLSGEPSYVVGEVGEVLFIENVARILVGEINAPAGVAFNLSFIPERVAAQRLARRLRISERGGGAGTGIVDFSFTSSDPDLSISVINAVVREYQRQSLSRRSAEIDQSIDFIQKQIPISDQRMQAALSAFNSYIEKAGAYTSLSSTTQDVLARIVDVESKIEEISFQKSQLITLVTRNHPDFQRLIVQETELIERLRLLRAELDSVPETEQKLAQLTKNVQAASELKEQLLLRLDQLRIVKASAVGTIRVLEAAEDAYLSGPNRMRPVILAALIGILGSSAFVLFQNATKSGIEDEREIERLGLSVFATIPIVEGLRKSDISDKNYTLAISQPENLAIESLRAFRTGLHFSMAAKGTKKIAITSPAPNEGKSFVSLNLAVIAAQTGVKVLLIDTDLRRGELHKAFGLSRKSAGLATYLASRADLKEVLHRSDRLKFDFIPTGGYPPNPSELLSTDRFKDLLSEVEGDYDLIIFDCAPVLAVTDPIIVAGCGIPTFLVVTHLKTSTAEMEASVKSIENVGFSFAGVVLNSYDQKRSRYGGYSTKYGYYRGGYRYHYKSR